MSSIAAKSCSPDYIPTSFIKLRTSLTVCWSYIMANLLFAQGVFPQKNKSAIVTHVLKKPNFGSRQPLQFLNYWPICNANNISKMLECLFLSRLQSWVIENPTSLNSTLHSVASLEEGVIHNTAKNRTDNLLSYPPDNHHCSDAVHWWGRADGSVVCVRQTDRW